jgi:hypothetical protein
VLHIHLYVGPWVLPHRVNPYVISKARNGRVYFCINSVAFSVVLSYMDAGWGKDACESYFRCGEDEEEVCDGDGAGIIGR